MKRSIASATARLPMAPANYWLLKSEPSDYSIAMMQKEQRTVWDGVRNAVAQKNMRSMAVGDRCLFYHSSCKLIGIVGLVSVCRAAYDDPTDGKYSVVDVQHEETWPQLLSLDTLKMHKETTLNGLALLRMPRLSVQPVSRAHYEVILGLASAERDGGDSSSVASGAKRRKG